MREKKEREENNDERSQKERWKIQRRSKEREESVKEGQK
jgi:hypothetical protein